MAVNLHRCRFVGNRGASHGCWRVQSALDDMGIEYEIVKVPSLPRSRRKDVMRLTRQRRVPVIEFADGTAYREESEDMAIRIRAGRLFEGRDGGEAA